jgi:probable F420-dependent oxidoreductase
MQIGLVYPQTEFGNDISAIKDYTQAAEELGFSHILAYDHVLGANPDRPQKLTGPYTYKDSFQSPLLLFSFMAAITERIGFATGIIILPQRQTALFAKQSATLDVLSNGRLRLGIGIGWNDVEYTALGQDFHTRGKRVEEQVNLLRQLWTQPLITFEGQWDKIPDAGLNPLPLQRPIPIWLGGHAKPVLRRIASMGDGWMPNYQKAAEAQPSLDYINRFAEEKGRDPKNIGLEARIHYRHGTKADWVRNMREWEEAGATHITFNTMSAGLDSPQKHIQAVYKFAEAAGMKAN